MTQNLKRLFKKLLRVQRGAMLIITTVYLPVIAGFFTLAVDMSYVWRTYNMLQTTADAAALAAMEAQTLPVLDATIACTWAQNYASKNMAAGSYGNVLKAPGSCSDVVIGMWSCPANQTCTQANFVSNATTNCGTTCNAIQVTTRMSTANSNSLQLAFAAMIGIPTFNVTATAISTYGNDPGALPWNVALVQDVSGSFSAEIANAKVADQVLANCMLNATPGSKLGINVFGQTSSTPFEGGNAIAVNGNSAALTSDINGISVGGNNMPSGSGTDIAAGINSAINQICPNSSCTANQTTFKPAIVLITDGEPNTCGGQSCSVATAKANAEAAATAAANMGMDLYAIYFCNDGSGTCSSNQAATDITWLSGLVKGNGKFAATPTPAQMAALMGTSVCKPALKVRLVL